MVSLMKNETRTCGGNCFPKKNQHDDVPTHFNVKHQVLRNSHPHKYDPAVFMRADKVPRKKHDKKYRSPPILSDEKRKQLKVLTSAKGEGKYTSLEPLKKRVKTGVEKVKKAVKSDKAKRIAGAAAGATLGYIVGNVKGAVAGGKLGYQAAKKKYPR